jgi:small-conductance mechanosensitive channel
MSESVKNMAHTLKLDTEVLYYYGGIAVKVIVIFVLARFSIFALNKLIVRIFKLYPRFKMDEKKTGTLTGLLKSVIKYVVYAIMGISILQVLNIPAQPILATAGLGGVAIGFGAQSLVKDVFTGFFILFEDQYAVGDYVTINGVTGTVEEMGLRITRIRSFKGEQHILPNGEIKAVTNLSRGNSLAVIDVGITYESDREKAMDVLSAVASQYFEKNKDKVAESPEVQGIIKLGESDVVIRTILPTFPLMHWKVEREMRLLVLEAFKAENIEIPDARKVLLESK